MYFHPGRYYKIKEDFQSSEGYIINKDDFVYCCDASFTNSTGEPIKGELTFSNMYGKFSVSFDEARKYIQTEESEEADKLPTEEQVGGNHYKKYVIQPFEFIQRNNLNFAQGNIIKYVCRYKDKGGLEDLKKARHYIDLIMQTEYGTNI